MIHYCGYIALVGRPNVGKSTLLNRLIQQKLSITSRKPQTTRHQILGIETSGAYQFIYVDTPGIHREQKKMMNRLMNKTALTVLQDVDIILWVIEALKWQEEDDYILSLIKKTEKPLFLVINKIDKVSDKLKLLPFIETLKRYSNFKAIIPISAKKNIQIESLQKTLEPFLPEGPHLFEADDLTDRSMRFLCAERLREKIIRSTGQELPYTSAVEIESFKEEAQLIRIHALIWVEKESHKRMIIGKNGSKLKEIATEARKDMEALLNKKVFLQCFCKVKTGWADNERILKQLGYDN